MANLRQFSLRFTIASLVVLLLLATVAGVLLIGFLFKGFVFAYLGEEAYAERVTSLQSGTAMEKAGAWVMQPDPATLLIANSIGAILAD